MNLFADVASAVPGLIYLRLSAFYEVHQLPNILAEALSPDDRLTPHRLPPSVRQVIVQPLEASYDGDDNFGEDEHLGINWSGEPRQTLVSWLALTTPTWKKTALRTG